MLKIILSSTITGKTEIKADKKKHGRNSFLMKVTKSIMGGYQVCFPANFIHDGSQEVLDLFPDNNGFNLHKINNKNNITGGKYYKSGRNGWI